MRHEQLHAKTFFSLFYLSVISILLLSLLTLFNMILDNLFLLLQRRMQEWVGKRVAPLISLVQVSNINLWCYTAVTSIICDERNVYEVEYMNGFLTC